MRVDFKLNCFLCYFCVTAIINNLGGGAESDFQAKTELV